MLLLFNGEVAEWLKAAVLKTVVVSGYRGFESLPLRNLPTLLSKSLKKCFYSSGNSDLRIKS